MNPRGKLRLAALLAGLLAPLLGTTAAEATEDPTTGRQIPGSNPIAARGFAFEARLSYDGWLSGKAAGRNINTVFAAGGGTQLDLGYILSPGFLIYAGWEHSFYGTGSLSPYADLPTSHAAGDYFMVGLRGGCTERGQTVGMQLSADLGYRLLRADGSDSVGGSASISLPTVNVRPSFGACFRPASGLVIAPTLAFDAGLYTGDYSGDVVTNGRQRPTSGTILGGTLLVAWSPGIAMTGELPF